MSRCVVFKGALGSFLLLLIVAYTSPVAWCKGNSDLEAVRHKDEIIDPALPDSSSNNHLAEATPSQRNNGKGTPLVRQLSVPQRATRVRGRFLDKDGKTKPKKADLEDDDDEDDDEEDADDEEEEDDDEKDPANAPTATPIHPPTQSPTLSTPETDTLDPWSMSTTSTSDTTPSPSPAPSSTESPTPEPTPSPSPIPPLAGSSLLNNTLRLAVSLAVPTRQRRRRRNLLAPMKRDVAQVMTQILQSPASSSSSLSSVVVMDVHMNRLLLPAAVVSMVYEEEQSTVLSAYVDVDVSWWTHTVAYAITNPNEMTADGERQALMELAVSTLHESITSGMFEQLLRKTSPQVLLAVAIPGEELNHAIDATTEDGSTEKVDDNDDNDNEEEPREIDPEENSTLWSPLNVREWDARRWAGVGLLGATVLVTCVLMYASYQRRQSEAEKELWGAGLATERDVTELLNIGWQSTGDRMTVYSKEKEGYRDDDSMLMGGVHHTEPVTNPSSGTSNTDK